MDPVMATRTPATYRLAPGRPQAGCDGSEGRADGRPTDPSGWAPDAPPRVADGRTRECYPVVPACPPLDRPYRAGMSTPAEFPTPREGLDNGSLAELCTDSREVQIEVQQARPWAAEHRDIVVPDDASSLLEGIDAYGS